MECVFEVVSHLISKTYGQQLNGAGLVKVTPIGRAPNRNLRPKREWWSKIRPEMPARRRPSTLDRGSDRDARRFSNAGGAHP